MWRTHSCVPCRDSSRHLRGLRTVRRRWAPAWVPTRHRRVRAPHRHRRMSV